MALIGNILWFIVCGWWLGLIWLFFGLLWCITIIGIPIGVQTFKLSNIGFLPFGKEIQRENTVNPLGLILNILWIIFGGLELAFGYLIAGLLCCITIIGIPFGVQCFKTAGVALMPFGTKIVKKQ